MYLQALFSLFVRSCSFVHYYCTTICPTNVQLLLCRPAVTCCRSMSCIQAGNCLDENKKKEKRLLFPLLLYSLYCSVFLRVSLACLYQNQINMSIRNIGSRIASDHAMYPKKEGILILFSSAMDLTMKFGALPI